MEGAESPKDALKREILEELGVDIEVGDHIHEVPFSVEDKAFNLVAFHAKHIAGEYRLVDHKRILPLPSKPSTPSNGKGGSREFLSGGARSIPCLPCACDFFVPGGGMITGRTIIAMPFAFVIFLDNPTLIMY